MSSIGPASKDGLLFLPSFTPFFGVKSKIWRVNARENLHVFKIKSHVAKEQWMADNHIEDLWQRFVNQSADELYSARAATLATVHACVMRDWADDCVAKVLRHHVAVIEAWQGDPGFAKQKQGKRAARSRETKAIFL